MRLTIAIPTYHRPEGLLRLLRIIDNELKTLSNGNVDIIIRDNSNDDVTRMMMNDTGFISKPWLDYKKNEKNFGFDVNMLNLYCETKGDYVWFVGDDDVIFEGSISKVLELIEEEPDIVHLPFRQPQGLTIPQYQASPRIKSWTEIGGAVEQILKYIKITSFVLRRKNVKPDQQKLAHDFGYSGWMHLILGFEVLVNSSNVNTITLSEFFAGSLDTEWKVLNWTPEASLLAKKLYAHPIFTRFDLKKEIKHFETQMYLGGIQTTLLVTSGALSTLLPMEKYLGFGSAYPFHRMLLKKPVWLVKYIIIKLRLGFLMKPVMRA